MFNAPLGRSIQNNPPQTLESLHIYLLLVLGIAFVGGGLTVLGFVGHSLAAVGIGAGAMVAAGLIAVFFALAAYRPTVVKESAGTDAMVASDIKLRESCCAGWTTDQEARSTTTTLSG
jgi:hypothetical protein